MRGQVVLYIEGRAGLFFVIVVVENRDFVICPEVVRVAPDAESATSIDSLRESPLKLVNESSALEAGAC
jgi:hypothetical protein